MALYYINRQIVKEIAGKLDVLRNQNSFQNLLAGIHERFIEKEAVVHSYKMEHPDIFAKGNTNNFNAHVNKKKVKREIKGLRQAYNVAVKKFSIDNLNDKFIQNIAGALNPELFPSGSAYYRNFLVRVSDANWTPPNQEKIPMEMDRYFKELKELLSANSLQSNLEASAYAHLHLARIHPFEDGNGRTARTLQNVILHSAGLTPPIIYIGERYEYHQSLQDSIWGWRKRCGSVKPTPEEIEQEGRFYNFIAGKISATLDRLL